MAKNDTKKRNWRDKYRFAVFNDTTFEEKWRISMTRYNLFIIVSLVFITIVGSTASLIAFTKLREFIPGYPDAAIRRTIKMNELNLDSLEMELARRDRYFQTLNDVISGKTPADRLSVQDTSRDYKGITFNRSVEDSLLRAQVESEEKYNLVVEPNGRTQVRGLTGVHFFPPVRGFVSGKFSRNSRHFGTDIVPGSPKAIVAAALDGVVIFTGWTMETGFVIQVQHDNNLISIYKHNAQLLKEAGDDVRAGEAISIVGDSGEIHTSGPHLHFELWYNGEPIDPEKYILF
jgi:murein DD-endopeptidase MepM/ murein hydrolase activator NlpD